MLCQVRLWDFRDIFLLAILYYGSGQACDMIFGSSEIPIARLLQDWSIAIYNKFTNLALLDIFVPIAFRRRLSLSIVVGIERLVGQAGVLVYNIV
jgi:hypothetical protein